MKADGTIVVIGGSSGIGLAVARRSLDDGATVVIAGRSQQRLDAARADLARTGPPAGRLSAHPVDIGDPAQVEHGVAAPGPARSVPCGSRCPCR